jgi:membrane-associated protease RseP (regulator of RpoE activity)
VSEGFGVLAFILVTLGVILLHEAGHFLTAKAFKIKVEEFFLGFGPRLWSFRRGETEYGIKAIPAGGYVRIAGMNPFEDEPAADLPRTFGAKPAWQRAIVILAGPVTHFVVAAVVLFAFFIAIGSPTPSKPLIDRVVSTVGAERSPASQAGLRAGDLIVALNGGPVGLDRLSAFIHSHAGTPLTLTVRRDGRLITVRATPHPAILDGKPVGLLGLRLAEGRERVGAITAAGRSVTQVASTAKQVVVQLGRVVGPSGLRRIGELLLGSRARAPSDATSIVGATQLAGEAARAGAWDFLIGIIVVFNVFVGILNLIPLPPLDGGHLAVIAYEKLRRRRPDARKLVPLTALVTGFIVLLAVSLAYIDITNPIPNPFR